MKTAESVTGKECSKCGLVKTLDGFSPAKHGKHGRHSVCKMCTSAYQRDYYASRKGQAAAGTDLVPAAPDTPPDGRLLDISKPVQTRLGWPARILCADFKDHDFSIVAAITMPNGYERFEHYTPSGHKRSDGKRSDDDLMNTPERKVAWTLIARRPDGQALIRGPFISENACHQFADCEKLMVVECRMLEWTE